MHLFDYSFLKELQFSASFANRLAKIEGFKARSSRFAEENPDIARDMVNVAKVMSIRESNAIEGISTEDSRLMALLSGKVRPRGHDEYELLGYRDALDRIHREHGSMEVDESTILDVYRLMVSYTDVEPGYKSWNNEIVERNGEGRIVKRYKTVPANKVEHCMYQLIGAFNEARNDMGISNILLIPCFIMDFLKIHPFMDGNGRMSRLLTVLLLYQEGFEVCSFVSLEAIINQSKIDYYDALQQSGEGWFDNMSDYMPFIEYLIGVIYLAYRELDRRMMLCTGRSNKEDRIERLIMNVSMPISKWEICAFMPDVSESYVELILGNLVKEGKVKRIGANKSSRYMPVDDHR